MQSFSPVITGTGMSVPEKTVTNDDLAKLMDTSDKWISERTGIKERRYISPEEGPADLAEEASRAALKNAGLVASDIDLVIVSTLSPQHFFPGTAFFLQRQLGLKDTPCFDLHAQCSGFIYALSVAAQFIKTGHYEKVLVCGAEVHSKGLDFSNRGRHTTVLFGDGAGAAIIERSEAAEVGIIDTIIHADGAYAEKLWIEEPGLGCHPHISATGVEEGRVYPQMDGPYVFKHAVRRMPEVVGEVLKKHHLCPADIDLFVFHQANLRINESVARTLRLDKKQVFNNIHKYGNCSSASIPMAFHEAVKSHKIGPGSLVCMAGFGAGFTWGANIIRL